MPQTNADRLLNRITALHKSLQLDEGGHVSKMERDLMLNYLREFYEIYASGTIAPPAAKASPETIVETPKPTEAPRPVHQSPPETAGPPASVVAPPSVSVPPTPPRPAVDSSFSQPAETAPAEYRANEPDPEPTPRPEPTHNYQPERVMRPTPAEPRRMPEVPSVPVPPPAAPAYTSRTATVQTDFASTPAPGSPEPYGGDKDLEALFEDQGTTSRFGRQPINDLTRCLSINNRILFTRDLFGGDNDLLNTTMQQLNTSGDMREARPLVSSLARRFSWTDEGKQESAKEFIELIRRRYV